MNTVEEGTLNVTKSSENIDHGSQKLTILFKNNFE
jgi:hypothetical protein